MEGRGYPTSVQVLVKECSIFQRWLVVSLEAQEGVNAGSAGTSMLLGAIFLGRNLRKDFLEQDSRLKGRRRSLTEFTQHKILQLLILPFLNKRTYISR